MSGSTTCPGCGLQLPASDMPWDRRRNASPECWQLYGEVQGFALRHLELVRDFHQLTVDAYAAQHAPREMGEVPPISVAYALVGLHLALDRRASGAEVRAAHQRMGKPDPSWPRLPTPERSGAISVFDVAAAGAMVGLVAGHAKAVRAWPPPCGWPGPPSTLRSPCSPTASCADSQPSRRGILRLRQAAQAHAGSP